MGGGDSWLAHSDAIDSTAMVTDETGAMVWDQVFGPWGQIWQQTGTRPWFVFGGLRWPVNDPLHPSATREFSSNVFRWNTPDPDNAGADVGDSQSWNAYAYALNNPTTLNDPEGTDVQVCLNNENGGQDCQWYSDEEYNKYAAAQNATNQGIEAPVGNASNLGHPTGNITCGTSVCGTVQWGEAPSQSASVGPVEIGLAFAGGVGLLRGTTGDIGEGAASWIGRMLGVGAGEGATGTATAETGATVDEVVARASSAVGNPSVRVGSEQEAQQAADEFLRPGKEVITDRQTGAFRGWKSADGTRIVIDTHTDPLGPHMNFHNTLTGGNLHVRW
jgi:RHS repeat-associated protein